MRPVVAIVGRPNVGKSTLFNRLLGRRKAITTNEPGVTRDLNYAEVDEGGRRFTIVDTGGFEPDSEAEIPRKVILQTRLAIEEADLIILVMDGRTGPTPQDRELVHMLRMCGKPVVYVINKIDSAGKEAGLPEFFVLGIDDMIPVSAEHGRRMDELLDRVLSLLPPEEEETGSEEGRIRVAIVGRPNVGKSSLLNRLLKKERAIVSDLPGTTRDALDTPLDLDGRRYLFIDTAGIRRKARISRTVEVFSVMGAIRSIERADVVLLVLDGTEGVMGQDERIAGLIEERARACIIVVNKWDLVEKDARTSHLYTGHIRSRIRGLSFAPVVFVSAMTGRNIKRLFSTIDELFEQSTRHFQTSLLNRLLGEITSRYTPPSWRGREVKLYYITQTGVSPPRFLIFTNHPEGIQDSYRRYIEGRLREGLGVGNVPVRVSFRRRR